MLGAGQKQHEHQVGLRRARSRDHIVIERLTVGLLGPFGGHHQHVWWILSLGLFKLFNACVFPQNCNSKNGSTSLPIGVDVVSIHILVAVYPEIPLFPKMLKFKDPTKQIAEKHGVLVFPGTPQSPAYGSQRSATGRRRAKKKKSGPRPSQRSNPRLSHLPACKLAGGAGLSLKPHAPSGCHTGGFMSIWLWVKNRYPKWSPGKWNQGGTPAAPALVLTQFQGSSQIAHFVGFSHSSCLPA